MDDGRRRIGGRTMNRYDGREDPSMPSKLQDDGDGLTPPSILRLAIACMIAWCLEYVAWPCITSPRSTDVVSSSLRGAFYSRWKHQDQEESISQNNVASLNSVRVHLLDLDPLAIALLQSCQRSLT